MNQFPLNLVTVPLRRILFDPKTTASLYVALAYYPSQVESILPVRLHPLLRQLASSSNLLTALKVLFGIGALRAANNKLSSLVVNNWKSNAKFVKSQELVLITGGCSGIGEMMAVEFARKGVKVVVLDLKPSKTDLRELDLKCRLAVSERA